MSCVEKFNVQEASQVRKRRRLLKKAGGLSESELLWLLRRQRSGDGVGEGNGHGDGHAGDHERANGVGHPGDRRREEHDENEGHAENRDRAAEGSN